MRSRRDGIFILCIVFIAAVLAGCGAAEQRPALERIEYTNLNDSGSRELLQELLSDTGVSDGRVQGFFRRVDRSRSRDTGGTGLGLAIVKHALQRHGAKLEVHSQLGQGATFSAVFPAQRLRRAQAA